MAGSAPVPSAAAEERGGGGGEIVPERGVGTGRIVTRGFVPSSKECMKKPGSPEVARQAGTEDTSLKLFAASQDTRQARCSRRVFLGTAGAVAYRAGRESRARCPANGLSCRLLVHG